MIYFLDLWRIGHQSPIVRFRQDASWPTFEYFIIPAHELTSRVIA